MKITYNKRGYYTLWVDGKFFGNYDTESEAEKEYEMIFKEE